MVRLGFGINVLICVSTGLLSLGLAGDEIQTVVEQETTQSLSGFARVKTVDADCAAKAKWAVSVSVDRRGNVTTSMVPRQLPDRGHLTQPQGLPFDPGDELTSAGSWLVLETSLGWLVGLNHGEFGGGLWAFSTDGERRRALSDKPIVALLRRHEQTIVVEQTAFDAGAVRVLEPSGVSWEPKPPLALDGVPLYATVQGEDLLVLTTRRVAAISPSGVASSFEVPELSVGARPFSLALGNGGRLYVGVSMYLVVGRPATAPEYYTPTACLASAGIQRDSGALRECGCQ